MENMNVRLRKMELCDGKYMLEWMRDSEITAYLLADFEHMSMEDCHQFIKASYSEHNIHYAIINDSNQYLGTISLKNISLQNRNAEYAIVLRRKAIGRGIAAEATSLILRQAFVKLKLHRVYLNVFSDNARAIRFYEKFGFVREGSFRQHIIKNENGMHDLVWYSILKDEFIERNAAQEMREK